jgi:hypothetical protein
MLLGVKLKQPDERLDYDFLYEEWLGDSGDTIDFVSVAIRPPGQGSQGHLAASAAPLDPTESVQKVWVEGGTDGQEYTIEVTATTVAGRVKQDELGIRVQEF